MGKIRELTDQEVEKYRSSLLEIYGQYKLTPFVPGTYLNAYTDFIDVLALNLANESVRTSITPHRLRKLLYYSNPALCTSDKLEAPSFGIDFIQELDRILEKHQTSASDIKPEEKLIVAYQKKTVINKSVLSLLLTLIPIAVLGYWLYTKVQKPYYFRDDFDNNSLEQLRNRGWEVMDFDSSLFYPQDSLGSLILRSARGDYWVRSSDTPYVKNTLIHKLPNFDCFELTTKFKFNGNNEPWQQCGMILFDKNYNKIHNIRMTYAFMGETEPDALGDIYNRGYQIIKRDKGEASQIQRFLFNKETYRIITLFYKIKRNKDKYSFYYHQEEESDAFTLVGEMEFKFKPKYFALISFNGLRIKADGPLNNAASIPAYFDWIKVDECE